MGQGYSMSTVSAATATINIPELADLLHEKTLASGRFTKSVRARSQQGLVFVKALMKPYSAFDVTKYIKQLTYERTVLAGVPNALGYQRIVEVGTGGFLARQYIFSSVYDRISTRPFLEDIEKKWLAFQLLCALKECHAVNIYHGDIKTENILVTSWNWLYLTDFSSAFKPTNLPEDNPADFSFYFDTSGRRTCYLAPERFIENGPADEDTELNWAMDMFGAGCAIAEIFLEGPIFHLSQIFKYKSGEYSPALTHLNKIEDEEVRGMILNMIDLDPEKRYSAEQHLSFYRSKVFPEYFYSFLHQYMFNMTEPAAHRRIVSFEKASELMIEADDKIDTVYQDLDKIGYFLGYNTSPAPHMNRRRSSSGVSQSQLLKRSRYSTADTSLYDGTLLFLTLVTSSMRSTAKTSARLKACELLVAFAERLPDDAKLDRIMPYIVGLLSDPSDIVKVAALYAMTSIFDMVEVVSPVNAYIFPEYIFPQLRQLMTTSRSQPSPFVRAAYASCLASLALSSVRVLDMVQAIRADGRLLALHENEVTQEISYHGLYDKARAELVPHFEEATIALISDPEPSVRRALLGSVSRLCVFFGSARASDVILTHLYTYLNEKDWMLKCSFFDALVGVASYVGTSSLEQFILPIMTGSLTDPEVFVVERIFRSLSRMAALGLFQKSTIWELVGIATRYLIHPSQWIRESAAQFITTSSKYLSVADRYCIVTPMIQPFLKTPINEITEAAMLDNLKRPLTRAVFESALFWASRRNKSLFWTAASRDGVFTLSPSNAPQSPSAVSRRLLTRIPPSQKDKDDQVALETLRNLGMNPEDEFKLIALREYILKISAQKRDDEQGGPAVMLNKIVSLNRIDVTPQSVFIDENVPFRKVSTSRRRQNRETLQDERHTLADALLDASTTIDTPNGRRQSSWKASQTPDTTPSLSKPIDIRNGEVRALAGTPDIQVRTAPSSLPKSSPSSSNKPSPSNLDRLSVRRDTGLSLRPHNSAINLLSKHEGKKAEAEISTTPETAFGRLDNSGQRRTSAEPSTVESASDSVAKLSRHPSAQDLRIHTFAPNHTYHGSDPNVLRLLDHHFTENYPVDIMEFGELLPNLRPKQSIRKATDMASSATASSAQETNAYSSGQWRPSGQLLTQFAEHTAAINKICVSPDHVFFVTASDDGTCKIWDTTRLEKNVTPRSRHTHRHAPGSKVKALCFVEGTHTFVSAANDGSIHAVKIEFKTVAGGDGMKFGKALLVRDFVIPTLPPPIRSQSLKNAASKVEVEYAVALHHFRSITNKSVLLVATSKCRILVIDMKTMDILHRMDNPVHHGTPTTFCIDKKHHWLLLGTSHGILDLWDLRFTLRLRSFGIHTRARIDRVVLHPSRGHGRWVIVSAGGELSVWDVEKIVCREVLRPATFNGPMNHRPYEAWFPDDESSEKMLQRFSTDIRNDETLIEPEMRDESTEPLAPTAIKDTAKVALQNAKPPLLTIPALHVVVDYVQNASQPDNPNSVAILLSGGADRGLRYWDISRPEHSFVISAPQILSVDGSNIKAKYDISHPLSLSAGAQIALVQETIGDLSPNYTSGVPDTIRGTGAGTSGKDGSRTTPKKSSRAKGEDSPGTPTSAAKSRDRTISVPGTPSSISTTSTTNIGGPAGHNAMGSRAPRNTIISVAQQQLLKTHMDGIMDVAVLRKPYGCVVSVDRGGCIYVFH